MTGSRAAPQPDDLTNVEAIFEDEDGSRLAAWFAALGCDTLVLAPPFLRACILARAPDCAAQWGSGLPGAAALPAGTRNIVVVGEFAADEAQAEEFYGRLGCGNVFGFYSRIIPAINAAAEPTAFARLDPPRIKYALLCLPRSGSEFLRASLTNAGIGAPFEHLRVSAEHAMSRAGLPFARWLEAIEVYGSVNGVFGTKIIPQHLVPVSGRRFATLEANIRELVARGFALVHLRRNLADCIVSSLVAFAGGTWHVFDDDDRSRFEREIRLSAIDDALVQRQITHYLADFVVLRSVLRGHAVTELDYDAMTGAPAAAVEQVRRALALDPAPLAAHVPLPHRMSAASSAYGAVRCRVDDMIARRREPLAAIALRRIAAKTGFDAAGVRRCLGFDMDRLAAMLHSLDQVK